MRVVNSSMNRKFGVSVNDVHSKLNKSMNKISSGKAYENAAQNPLAYYEGMKIDNQYQDTLSKLALNKDVKNRLYQQELGVRSIQSTLNSKAGDNVNSKINYILNTTNNEISTTVTTVRDDLIQKQQSMINDLNAQYENFFVYGCNDLSTTPFELTYKADSDEMIMKYHHKFSGDSPEMTFEFKMESNKDGTYSFKFQDNGDPDSWKNLQKAMIIVQRIIIGITVQTIKAVIQRRRRIYPQTHHSVF